MRQGALSDYFIGVGAKVLRGTEVDPYVSHGHEFQGVSDFREFLGSPIEKVQLDVTYVWLSDEEPPVRLSSSGTWYDSRRGQGHRGPEYRLYYPADAEDIVHRARAGDSLFLCQPRDGSLVALLCAHGTSIEQQLLWLFGLQLTPDARITQTDFRTGPGPILDLTARYVLDLVGVEVLATEEDWTDRLLSRFGESFPTTREFSDFARAGVTGVDPVDDPDRALLEWMDFEERLFMTLEKHIVGQRLQKGFLTGSMPDVDAFINFSLSVHNRRKARAGFALANHTEVILRAHGLRFTREATTEKRNGPDFLFPGEKEYHDPAWPDAHLTMLGAKTSCKDRWRQVLAEAGRISPKHLLTFEPGISETQTDEMRRENLQLVVPRAIHRSYRETQRPWLMDVKTFLEMVRQRQGV